MDRDNFIKFLEREIADCESKVRVAIQKSLWCQRVRLRLMLALGVLYNLLAANDIYRSHFGMCVVDCAFGLGFIFLQWSLWRHTIRRWRESRRNWARLRDLLKHELTTIQDEF